MSVAERVGAPRPLWLPVAALGYACLGATFASHSVPALVAVLIPGVVALIAVLVTRRPRVPARIDARHLPWLVWAVAFGLWELAALLLGELSFSLLMDPVLEIYPLRVGGWLLWLSAGWLLVRRP
jgi:hypothetical protein